MSSSSVNKACEAHYFNAVLKNNRKIVVKTQQNTLDITARKAIGSVALYYNSKIISSSYKPIVSLDLLSTKYKLTLGNEEFVGDVDVIDQRLIGADLVRHFPQSSPGLVANRSFFEKKLETELLETVVRVNEFAFHNLQTGINDVLKGLSLVFSLLCKPFVALYNLINGDSINKPLTDGNYSQKAMLAQIDFVSRLLDAEDPVQAIEPPKYTKFNEGMLKYTEKEVSINPPTRTQKLSQILKDSIVNAERIRFAAEKSGSNYIIKKGETQRSLPGFLYYVGYGFDNVVKELTNKIVSSDAAQPIVLPLSVGSGVSSLNHFLIIYPQNSKYTIKHLTFSAENFAGKIPTVHLYELDLGSIESFIEKLIHFVATDFANYEKRATSSDIPFEYCPALEELLTTVATAKGVSDDKVKASKDPVKAIYYLLKELKDVKHPKNQEQRRVNNAHENTYQDTDFTIFRPYTAPYDVSFNLLEDKAFFYNLYVKHLIDYYQTHQAKLSTTQQLEFLKTIESYIERTQHYMEKELTLEVAQNVMLPLKTWFEDNFKKFQGIKCREEDLLKSLDSAPVKAQLVLSDATIVNLNSNELQNKPVLQAKITHQDEINLQELKEIFIEGYPEIEQREEALRLFNTICSKIDSLLDSNQPHQARLLAKELIHIIPPPTLPSMSHKSFWESIYENGHEAKQWSEKLSTLSEGVFEAVLKSGDTTLSSDLVVDYSINLTLVQRKLFEAQIRVDSLALTQKIHAYNKLDVKETAKAKKINQIDKLCVYFIKKRQEEIKVSLRAIWKAEDKEEVENAKIRLLNEKNRLTGGTIRDVPKAPNLVELKKSRFNTEKTLLGTIDNEKKIGENSKDAMIKMLLSIRSSPDKFDLRQDFFSELEQDDIVAGIKASKLHSIISKCEVYGHLMRIIGVSKKDIGSYLLQSNPLAISFYGLDHHTLFYTDSSLIQGLTTGGQKRFNDIEFSRSLMEVKDKNFDFEKYLETTAHILLGYDNHSKNYKYIEAKDEEKTDFETFISTQSHEIRSAFLGYKDQQSTESYFVPASKSTLHRHDYLQKGIEQLHGTENFASSFFTWISSFFSRSSDDIAVGTMERKKYFQSLKRIGMGYSRSFAFGHNHPCVVFGEKTDIKSGKYCFRHKEMNSTITSTTTFDHAIEHRVSTTFISAPSELTRAAHEYDEIKTFTEVAFTKKDDLDGRDPFEYLNLASLGHVPSSAPPSSTAGEFEGEVGVKLGSQNNYFAIVTGAFHNIYHNRDSLENEADQQILYARLFQSGVMRAMLRSNPQFFIKLKNNWNEWLHYFRQTNSDKAQIFLRDCAERIRQIAKIVYQDDPNTYQEISDSLPEYNDKTVLEICIVRQGDEEQKFFSIYMLVYYLNKHKRLSERLNLDHRRLAEHFSLDDFTNILNAYYVTLASPLTTGHPFLMDKVLSDIHSAFLVPLGVILNQNENIKRIYPQEVKETVERASLKDLPLRDALLNRLSGCQLDEHTWHAVADEEFVYQSENGLLINLISCVGFTAKINVGRVGQLPSPILKSDEYEFLFGKHSPLVDSNLERFGNIQIMKYSWIDDAGVSYFAYIFNKQVFICQQTPDKKIYQFSIRSAEQSQSILQMFKEIKESVNPAKNVQDSLLYKFVKNYGTWTNTQEPNEVIIARNSQKIHEEPIYLDVRGKFVKGAYLISKDGVKKWICDETHAQLEKILLCTNSQNILLLRSDGSNMIDEIRIPIVSFETSYQINQTIASARLQNIATSAEQPLELKLVRRKDGSWEDETRPGWVWQTTGTEKLEERFGENYRHFMLPLKNESREGQYEIWFWGHPLLIIDKNTVINPIQDIKLKWKDSIQSPCFKYNLDQTGEFSTHAGFFYLSYLAFFRKDIAEACRMLDKMVNYGVSMTIVDIEKLNTVFSLFMSSLSLGDLKKLSLHVDSGRKVAFLLKALLSTVLVCDRLLAGYPNKREMLTGLIAGLVQSHGLSALYIYYSKSIEKCYQDFADHGLLLTEAEKRALNKIIESSSITDKTISRDYGFENFWHDVPDYTTNRVTTLEKSSPKAFKLPSSDDFENFLTKFITCVEPRIVPVNRLHSQYGAYVTKATVLSHFWSYWTWIAENDLEEKDIAFLYTPLVKSTHKLPLPKEFLFFGEAETVADMLIDKAGDISLHVTDEMPKEVETARALLLFLYHYKNSHKDSKSYYKSKGNHKSLVKLYQSAISVASRYPSLRGIENSNLGLLLGIYNSSGSLLKMGEAYLSSLYQNYKLSQVLPEKAKKDNEGNPQDASSKALFENLKEYSTTIYTNLMKGHESQEQDLVFTLKGRMLQVHFDDFLNSLNLNEKADRTLSLDRALCSFISSLAKDFEGMSTSSALRLEHFMRKISDIESLKIFLGIAKEDETQMSLDVIEVIKRAIQESIFENCKNVFKQAWNMWPVEFKQNNGFEIIVHQLKELHTYLYAAETQVQKSFKFLFSQLSPLPEIQRNFDASISLQNTQRVDWKKEFFHSTSDLSSKSWQENKEQTVNALEISEDMSEMEQAVYKALHEGLNEAANEIQERSNYSLDIQKFRQLKESLNSRLAAVKNENNENLKKILSFAKRHAVALNLLPLLTASSNEVIIVKQLEDLYKQGLIHTLLKSEKYTSELERTMTAYLLSNTEYIQLQKSESLLKEMKQLAETVRGNLIKENKKAPRGEIGQILQERLNHSKAWISNSYNLMHTLEEGGNRLRYAEMRVINGTSGYYLKLDKQSFYRKYLVMESRQEIITRPKAMYAIEKMVEVALTREGKDTAEAVQKSILLLLKMGIGKSTVIFPLVSAILVEKGLEPILITTETLINQLAHFSGAQAYQFNFSINYGIDSNDQAFNDAVKNGSEDEFVINHLRSLCYTLKNLKFHGRFPLATPQRLSSLSNKRSQLQEVLKHTELNPSNTSEKESVAKLIYKIELLKEIESVFYNQEKEASKILLFDEDTTRKISLEHNFAVTATATNVERVRLEVGREIVRMMSMNEKFKEMVANNDLRTIEDPQKELQEVVGAIYDHTDFWEEAGWNPEEWKKIDRHEFIAYICGLQKNTLPKNLKPWEDEEINQECPQAYVGVLRTMISETMKSVKSTNGRLQRGLNSSDKCSVVPYNEGLEKLNTRFGEDSELILHTVFHYTAPMTRSWAPIKQEDFLKIVKALKLRTEEKWKNWYSNISILSARFDGDLYTTFCSARDENVIIETTDSNGVVKLEVVNPLSLRLEFLQYVLLDSNYVKIYTQQIVCNNQHVGLGQPIMVASGTGDAYALNLTSDTSTSSDCNVIAAETLLHAKLDEPIIESFVDPSEFVLRMVKNKDCSAVMNPDFEICGNLPEKFAVILQTAAPDRQIIYNESKMQKGLMLNPHVAIPQPYDPKCVNKNSFTYFGPSNTRGTEVAIPTGENVFGVVMVGLGTVFEELIQAIGRERKLGYGQKIAFATDKKMERYVRKINGLSDTDTITKGHLVRAVIKRTIESSEMNHIKAATFSIQKWMRQVTQDVLRAPLCVSLRTLHGFELYAVSQKLLCEGFNDLVLMNKVIDYKREFQGNVKALLKDDKIARDQYLIQTCINELSSIATRKEAFEVSLKKFLKEKVQLIFSFIPGLPQSLMQHTSELLFKIVLSLDEEVFNSNYSNLAQGLVEKIPPDLKNSQLSDVVQDLAADFKVIIAQWFTMYSKIDYAKKMLEKEILKIKNDKQYQAFHAANLPSKISSSFNQLRNNHQEVQQHALKEVEKQVETKNHKQQTIEIATSTISKKPFSIKNFLSNGVGAASLVPDNDSLCRIFGVNPRNLFISPKASALKTVTGNAGQPIFYIIWIRSEKHLSSVVITQEDYCMKVGAELESFDYDCSIMVSTFSIKDYYTKPDGIVRDESLEVVVEHKAGPFIINEIGEPFYSAGRFNNSKLVAMSLVNKLLANWTNLTEEEQDLLKATLKDESEDISILKTALENETDPNEKNGLKKLIAKKEAKPKLIENLKKELKDSKILHSLDLIRNILNPSVRHVRPKVPKYIPKPVN